MLRRRRHVEPPRPLPGALLRVPLRRVQARRHPLTRLDLRAFAAIRRTARSRRIVRGARWLSFSGEHGALWLAIGALGFIADRRDRASWVRAVVSVEATQIGCSAIKQTIRRRRPTHPTLPPLIGTVSGLSFPSSHSGSAFAAARAYSSMAPGPPLYAAATAMALSRVYLGVHYPSDVLAGAGVGLILGSLGRRRATTAPHQPVVSAAATRSSVGQGAGHHVGDAADGPAATVGAPSSAGGASGGAVSTGPSSRVAPPAPAPPADPAPPIDGATSPPVRRPDRA